MSLKYKLSVLFLFIIAIGFLCPLQSKAQQNRNAQDSSDVAIKPLKNLFNNDYLSVGALLQLQSEVQWKPDQPGQNTFLVDAALVKLYGNLDDHFSYVLKADFSNTPSLLDANISYATHRFAVTAGAQKPGFSAEYLTSTSRTDFINRSRVVNTLAGHRDVGLLGHLALTSSLQFSAGMFNGDNQNLENSNNLFYYTGRLEFTPDPGPENLLRIGINAAHGIADNTVIGKGLLPAISGERTVYGGDIRLEVNRWLFSSELLLADLDYGPTVSDHVTGFHITGGYWITPKVQALTRLDHLESDVISINARNLLQAGLDYKCTGVVSFQLNYQINLGDAAFANHLWLTQVQAVF